MRLVTRSDFDGLACAKQRGKCAAFCSGVALYAEFGIDLVYILLYCAFGKEKFFGDFAVGGSFGGKAGYFLLLWRKAFDCGGLCAAFPNGFAPRCALFAESNCFFGEGGVLAAAKCRKQRR